MLTAEANVELPLLLTDLSKAQRKKAVAAALAVVGLSDRATHKPNELSGGQQQRVAIARALVADPTLLVCDEPTGDLDRKTADEVLTLLQDLNRNYGKTIIMVTHDAKAAEFATHRLHMDKGALGRRGALNGASPASAARTGMCGRGPDRPGHCCARDGMTPAAMTGHAPCLVPGGIAP